jgi:CO dehydrogenase/acetyl-CoA synthase alpha subunit
MSIYLFPQDKANHFIYGSICGLGTLAVLHVFNVPDIGGYGYSAGAIFSATLLGAFKELDDYILNRRAIAQGMPPPHGVEWMDMIATALGGLAMGIAHWL